MPILPVQQGKDEQYEAYGATGHPKHSTFYAKPRPAMQVVSEASQFNDRGRASLAYQNHEDIIRNPNMIPAVPTTWDTVYDPDHPDADWTGLVNKAHVHKKHVQTHASLRENIGRSENGIVSTEERNEFGRKKAPEDASIAQKNANGTIVIGGIDQPDERWKTTHQRMEQREPTYKDQMTMEKRAGAVRKINDPAQSRSQQQQLALLTDGSTPRGGYGGGFTSGAGGMPSSRATPSISFGGRSSLLNGLAQKMSVEPPPTRPGQGSYVHDTNRILVTENYRPYAPGYTGGRK